MTHGINPSPTDVPFNAPEGARLDPGEQLTVTVETQQRDTRFILPLLAASKHPTSEYVVRADGEVIYGPAPIPPTDIDDLYPTFWPPHVFQRTLEVVCRNLSSSTSRDYWVQAIGWEEGQ